MEERYKELLELQELDEELDRVRSQVEAFAPGLEELELPLVSMKREVEATGARLAEMKADARRLERVEQEKRDRLKAHEARLDRVRNAREEAATRTEIDLIRRAAEADEKDAIQLMDQIKRTDLKLDEVEKELESVRGETDPKREALLAERRQVEEGLQVLQEQRQNRVMRIDPRLLRLYERVRAGRTNTVLAVVTADGACGHCFNMIPIQEQAEIRRSDALARCESCGVILYPED